MPPNEAPLKYLSQEFEDSAAQRIRSVNDAYSICRNWVTKPYDGKTEHIPYVNVVDHVIHYSLKELMLKAPQAPRALQSLQTFVQ